ncbi:cytochrome c oxidase assembly protein [Brevundimonas sp. NPDC092305]|uniref:cytochrome c oxidase assembly protein n=1 Tax=Brevundimonas sp. NPDC092305 TaxID=3363957 RepID=UPI0037F3D39C
MTVWIPYCGPGSTPLDALERWNFDPIVLLCLAGMTVLACSRLRGSSRVSGLASVAVLTLSFVSPLCALSSALFAARTVHHVLLFAVAAPLIAFALPRRHVGSLALATLIQSVAFWVWHAPGMYEAALSSTAIYWVMQVSVLGTATWFWIAVRHSGVASAVIALLAAMVAMGLLGALLTFSPEALYAPHLSTTQAWGLTPLEDQQTAGLIMWAPAAAVYLAAALLVLGRWIGPDRAGPHAA